jgi:ribosome maturation factor RimP
MPPASAAASAAQARDHLVELLGPLVSDAGYDLEDVSITAAGRRSVVRVIVDADGGIDLDAVATVSRVISDALDADAQVDALPAYTLEVSSPGIDRPLSHERHWRRAAGRLVTVQAGGRTITGRVVSADADGVTFAIDGAGGARGSGDRTIGWADLGRGKVQVEFNRSEDD